MEEKKSKAHLFNLNFDPQLSGRLVHIFQKPELEIGNKKGKESDICMVGQGLHEQHAIIRSVRKQEEKSVNGVWWNVRNEMIGRSFQIVDAFWLISVLFWPMAQSGYFMWRNFDTHGLIITIGDNRDANDSYNGSHENGISHSKGVKVTLE